MKRMALGFVIAGCLMAIPMLRPPGTHSQATATSEKIQLVDPRKDSSELIADPAQFAWQLFIFVNWPELTGHRGAPDFNRAVGDAVPTVWESFKNASEVFQANGMKPASWEIDDELPPIPHHSFHLTQAARLALGPVDSNWVHFLSEQVMIDGQQICDANSKTIEYDVRGNEPYFDYIVSNPSGYELYNIEGQQAALADPRFTFAFPVEAIEIKASWRVFQPGEDASRYWTAIGVYNDRNGGYKAARIGLTGLHIISKATPNWVWITFEQVDNPTTTFKYYKGKKGASVGPNPNYDSSLNPINQQFQQALAGTKWQYYALQKVQTEFTQASNQPILMGNTQMETYFQQNSSCISCHNLASIGHPASPSQSIRLQLFYPLNPYVGAIDFQQVANQQYPGVPFKSMDFAWSLRNAHYKTPPPASRHNAVHTSSTQN